MKNIITILILFVAAGCSKQAKIEDSVVGTYEHKFSDGSIAKLVLLENGKVENQDQHGNPQPEFEGTWELSQYGEVLALMQEQQQNNLVCLEIIQPSELEAGLLWDHRQTKNVWWVLNIESNGDLTWIAMIYGGHREGAPTIDDVQITLKKVK